MATGVGSISVPQPTLSASSLGSARFLGDITLPLVTLSGALNSPLELPAFTLSATMVAGLSSTAALFVPAPTLSASALTGGGGRGDIRLPAPSLIASTGTKGSVTLPRLTVFATGLAGNTSRGRNRVVAGVTVYETQPTLPQFTLSATLLSQRVLTGDITLPEPTLTGVALSGLASGESNILLRAPSLIATGVTGGAPSSASLSIPEPTLSATLARGLVGTGSITLPELTLAGSAPAQPQPRTGAGDSTLPAATLQGTMLPGNVGVGSMSMREPELAGVLANSPPMTGAITLAEFTLVAQGLGSNAAVGVVRIPEHQLAAQGLTGNVGTAEISVPLVTLSAADGTLAIIGTANIVLPAFLMAAAGSGAGGQGNQQLPSPSFTSVVLNTRTKAVTQYAGLAPNSIASFGGVTLMATADGIVALTGGDDRGEPIDAYLTSGKSDLGQSGFKRVLTGYVGYRADGDMELTLIADDHHEHAYTLAPRRVQDQQHASRVKFGRGASGLYWQFKAANVDGSDFALDRLELLTALTGAKV